MTGRYPFAHGILGHSGYRLLPDCPTLAEVLKTHGYRTAAFVTGPLLSHTGLDRGFDEYHHRPPHAHLYTEWGNQIRGTLASYAATQDPWFLYVHLWELHTPRYLLPDYDTHAFGRHRYERALACLDRQLASLLEKIDLDSTVLVFHGDHGEQYKKPAGGRRFGKVTRWLGFGKKRPIARVTHGYHVYDILVRVPLIFVGPGLFPPGLVVSQQVRQVDIFSTSLDVLGIHCESEKELQGRSLLPLIRTGQGEEAPALVKACGRAIPDKRDWLVGIRTPEWKFVFAPDNPRICPELYHLVEDPSESQNVLDRWPEMAEQLKQMILHIHSGYPRSSMTSGEGETRSQREDSPQGDLAHKLEGMEGRRTQ